MQIKNFDLRHFFREDTMGGAGQTVRDLVWTQTEWTGQKKGTVRVLTESNTPICAMNLFNNGLKSDYI